MPVSPTGARSVALNTLKEALAQNSWFQTWTGTGTPAAAKARILIGSRDVEPGGETSDTLPSRPWVQLVIDDESGFAASFVANETFTYGLTAKVYAQGPVATEYQASPEDADYTADNDYAALAGALAGCASTDVSGVRLNILGVRETMSPRWPPREQYEGAAFAARFPYWAGELAVTIGVGAAA